MENIASTDYTLKSILYAIHSFFNITTYVYKFAKNDAIILFYKKEWFLNTGIFIPVTHYSTE